MATKKAKVSGKKDVRKRRKRERVKIEPNDFRMILDLPERLAGVLRELLQVSALDWALCIDRIRQRKPYKEWRKSKGPGKGYRHFAAPCDELKGIQNAILHRFLVQIPVHFARHGGVIGSSIQSNASRHAGFAKAVFAVDLINAFPSVLRSRVTANLRKPFTYRLRQFGGNPFPDDDIEAMLIALVDLLCWRDRLPQGPPTSPKILEIVCNKLDIAIFHFFDAASTPFQSFRYTAYADNLTISSDGEIPDEMQIAMLNLIRANGFIPHTRPDKTEYFSRATGRVPVITGIVLNADGRMTMAPRKLNQLRARLGGLLRLKAWDDEKRGLAAGTIGYIRQLYPTKLPSTIRSTVEKVEARLSA